MPELRQLRLDHGFDRFLARIKLFARPARQPQPREDLSGLASVQGQDLTSARRDKNRVARAVLYAETKALIRLDLADYLPGKVASEAAAVAEINRIAGLRNPFRFHCCPLSFHVFSGTSRYPLFSPPAYQVSTAKFSEQRQGAETTAPPLGLMPL